MRIAVLDIETTARYPQVGTIVEVGICMLDLETGFNSKLLDTVVREADFETKFEGSQLEKCWVFQNSDLTVNMVRNAPKWGDVVPKLERIFQKFPVTAYNKAFDLGFLRNRQVNVPQELPCPMITATPVLKIPGMYDDYKYPSVEESWRFFFPDKKNYVESHRAYDDAEHEALIVLELYKRKAWKPDIRQFTY